MFKRHKNIQTGHSAALKIAYIQQGRKRIVPDMRALGGIPQFPPKTRPEASIRVFRVERNKKLMRAKNRYCAKKNAEERVCCRKFKYRPCKTQDGNDHPAPHRAIKRVLHVKKFHWSDSTP
ncbi:MAG: hypothetical protein IKG52_03900 [Rhodobacteraceae bacterium]|nr:hypothetical protein [Paracoccaceae bacterium]